MFDRDACVNLDAVEYMKTLRGHLDKEGIVRPSNSGLSREMLLYKTHMALEMCKDSENGCRHGQTHFFTEAPEHMGRTDETRKRTPEKSTKQQGSSSSEGPDPKAVRTGLKISGPGRK